MTPKDKAKQLVLKYEKYLFNKSTTDNDWVQCIECAIIATEQLIQYQDEFIEYVRMELPSNVIAGIPYKYWDKVKQELEKL